MGRNFLSIDCWQTAIILRNFWQATFRSCSMKAPIWTRLPWYERHMFRDFDLKKYQEERRREREADAPMRALRLAPEFVELWTNVVRDASAIVVLGEKRCDYRPWSTALSKAGEKYGLIELRGNESPPAGIATRFSAFHWDVASPAWPDPRRDLIEFALTVLEADPKLFRSGNAQKYLIIRLKQSPLTDGDVARVGSLLRRTVTLGSGFEEFRAYCKLAGHLLASGRLKDLPSWLAPQAKGAILTLAMIDGPIWYQIFDSVSEEDLKRLSVGGVLRPYVNGVAWPELGVVVPAGKSVKAPEQRIKRNAWRMLDHILRRYPELSQRSST